MATDKILSLAEARSKKNKDAPTAPTDDPRPVIKIEPGELRLRVANEAEAAVLASDIKLYRQGGRLVRIIWDKIKVSGGDDGDVLRLSTVSDAHVLQCFEQSARFVKWSSSAEGYVPCNCPPETSQAYLARDGEWNLPYLMGVITAPVLRSDGSILNKPGYDKATGLVFDPAGWNFPQVPENPTKEDALAALVLLKHPLRKFPFIPGPSLAVALSGIMTAVLRRTLPTAPLHAYSAPVAGSGKSMLVDIASIIATGERAAVITTGRDQHGDAELEKRLVSSMLAGDAVLSLDNLDGPLTGEFLCALITQTRVKLRPLGRSTNVDVPVTTSFFSTSNNLVVLGDMTRRVMACNLDPEVERPELREFDFNPLSVVRDQRGILVCAVLTIVRAWLLSGEPNHETPLGSFEEWSRMIREPLIWLGEVDPVDSTEPIRKGDPRLAHLRNIMISWAEIFGDQKVTMPDITKKAEEQWPNAGPGDEIWVNKDFYDSLMAIAGTGKTIGPERLSRWLRKNQSRVVDGMRLQVDDSERRPVWQLLGKLPPKIDKPASKYDDDIPF